MSDKKKNPIKINITGVDADQLKVKKFIKPGNTDDQKGTMLKSLFNLFGAKVGYKDKDQVKNKPELFIPARQTAEKGRVDKLEPVPTHLTKLWDYWLNQCHDTKSSFQNIKEVFKDMDYMYYNSTIYSKDEKIEKEIVDLFNNLKIPTMLKETARSIVNKGNACWILNTKQGAGVIDVTPMKIESLVDRIEFAPLDVDTTLFKNQALVNLVQNSFRLKNLLQTIEDMEDYSAMFKHYLLGYQVNNIMLPPWNVLHFRNKALDTAFDPWGMPLMLNCVAPFRMYDAALTMQVIARGAKFPFEKYSLSMPNTMNPTEMLEALLEFAQEYENSGLAESRAARQDFSISSKIYTIKELFDFELVETKQNFDDIADVELHKDNLIIGTGIPRNFYDPNNGTFGNSGIALMQQYKPFARQVFNIQKSILEELTLLVKIHFIFKGIDPNTEFELSMPFPQSQENADVLNNKSTMLTFANSVLDALKANVIGDPAATLPPDLVARIYSILLPFERDEIEKWVVDTYKEKKKREKEGGGTEGPGGGAIGGAPMGGSTGGTNPAGEEGLVTGGETPTEAPAEGGGEAGGEILTAATIKKHDFYRTLLTDRTVKMYEYDLRKRNTYYEGLKQSRHYLHSYGVKSPFDLDAVFFNEKSQNDMQKISILKESDSKKLLNSVAKKFNKYNANADKIKMEVKEDEDESSLKNSRRNSWK
jgi:hypothetical protein